MGESAFLSEAHNVCTVRALTWCEVLVLDYKECRRILLDSEEENAHWMSTVAAVRWPRFVAAVQLSKWLRREQRKAKVHGGDFSAQELIRRLATQEETFYDETGLASVSVAAVNSDPLQSMVNSPMDQRSIGLPHPPEKGRRGGYLGDSAPLSLTDADGGGGVEEKGGHRARARLVSNMEEELEGSRRLRRQVGVMIGIQTSRQSPSGLSQWSAGRFGSLVLDSMLRARSRKP